MDPVAVAALGELIATAIAVTAGKSWKAIRPSREARMVKSAIDRALMDAFGDAYRGPFTADDGWVAAVAGIWERAFTAEVSRALIGSLANVNDGQREFASLAAQALHDSGCNVVELKRTFWVEQFLCVLPRLLFKQLEIAAVEPDSAVRDLVGHLLDRRADALAAYAQVVAATPRQFREDVIALLRRLDEEARTGRLPPYLPRGADVSTLARTVRVRRGVRTDLHSEGRAEAAADWAYRLPVERAEDSEPARPWREIAAENRRLVVLADPGLGKSWLIRTETHRLCRQALTAAECGDDVGALLIPMPVRCDQLVTSGGQSLAQAAAGHLVTQRLVPPRSRSGLEARIDAGGIVLLLDALDELTTDEQYGRLKELLRSWQGQAGEGARCVLTSRIAGYRGSPLPDACEVELQAFTAEDVTAAVTAWQLPPPVTARVLARTKDPAVAGMTRVPLLLALLCSLAAELPDAQQLPATRRELYERVLRWFLTRAHRADEHPGSPELRAEEVDAPLEILAPVAFHFATMSAGWTDLMPPDQLRTAIRLAGAPYDERHRSAGDILQELSISAGILVPAGNPSAGRHPSYLFLHRTVAEYLVARHLATLPAADWGEVVDQHLWFDPDWAEVIPLLGGLLDPSAARRLVEQLLRQAADPFHHALLTAVRVMAERPDLDRLLPAGHLQALAEAVLSRIDHPATRHMVASLLAAAARLPRLIVDGLLVRLDDPDEVVRRAAVRVLAGRDAPAVTDGLLARLDDPDRDVRRAAVEALAGRDEPAVTDGLLTRLDDPDRDVRRAAVEALAGRDGPAVTDGLLARLDAPDREVRRAAVRVFAGRHEPAVTDGLLARLDAADRDVRRAAVRVFAGRHEPAVTDGLLTRLDDGLDEGVRQAAVEALAGRTSPRSPMGCWPASTTRSGMYGGRRWKRWPAGTRPRSPTGCWPASTPRTGMCGRRRWKRWPAGTSPRSLTGCWPASTTRSGMCGRRRYGCWLAGMRPRSPMGCWPVSTPRTRTCGGRRCGCWPTGTAPRLPTGCWLASATRTGMCGGRRWKRWPAARARGCRRAAGWPRRPGPGCAAGGGGSAGRPARARGCRRAAGWPRRPGPGCAAGGGGSAGRPARARGCRRAAGPPRRPGPGCAAGGGGSAGRPGRPRGCRRAAGPPRRPGPGCAAGGGGSAGRPGRPRGCRRAAGPPRRPGPGCAAGGGGCVGWPARPRGCRRAPGRPRRQGPVRAAGGGAGAGRPGRPCGHRRAAGPPRRPGPGRAAGGRRSAGQPTRARGHRRAAGPPRRPRRWRAAGGRRSAGQPTRARGHRRAAGPPRRPGPGCAAGGGGSAGRPGRPRGHWRAAGPPRRPRRWRAARRGAGVGRPGRACGHRQAAGPPRRPGPVYAAGRRRCVGRSGRPHGHRRAAGPPR